MVTNNDRVHNYGLEAHKTETNQRRSSDSDGETANKRNTLPQTRYLRDRANVQEKDSSMGR